MCQWDAGEATERRGMEYNALNAMFAGVDDLINPYQKRTGLGQLGYNLNPSNWTNNDDTQIPEQDTTIEPSVFTNLEARQGEIDPRLKKRNRNLNSLRIREDLPQTVASPLDSQSSGSTNIIT